MMYYAHEKVRPEEHNYIFPNTQNILRYAFCLAPYVSTSPVDWCCPNSPASSGLNKSSHFRWESTPISQNALLLLVSGKMSPKFT